MPDTVAFGATRASHEEQPIIATTGTAIASTKTTIHHTMLVPEESSGASWEEEAPSPTRAKAPAAAAGVDPEDRLRKGTAWASTAPCKWPRAGSGGGCRCDCTCTCVSCRMGPAVAAVPAARSGAQAATRSMQFITEGLVLGGP
mmetsp:Transcript_11579/g.24410  ORF Transcript_11579/g.24410 Transcript_11579/m.24410 type:complete len:144 (-) Transcript_11579:112-543(-)